MLISTALAQAGGGAPAGGFDPIASLLPLVLIFAVFYFLLIRPQQKKMKEHKAMIEAVRRGDRIVTGGGLIGTVARVGGGSDDEVIVEIAEGVRVRVIKSTIAQVMAKTEPAKADDRKADKADKAAEKK